MKSSIHDERISSFLDDALPEAERVAFQAQLSRDPQLQQHVADLQQLRRDVATLPRYSVKEGFAQRVVAAAVAAKASEAKAAPAPRQPTYQVTNRRVIVGVLAVAATAGIIMASIPWLNTGKDPVTATNPVNANENNALAAVVAALPGEDEALVLRIRSPKELAAGKRLMDVFTEQGLEERRPSDRSVNGPQVGKAYRDQQVASKLDRNQLTPAAAAMYVEMSAEELQMALSQIAQEDDSVEFVPEGMLAVAKPVEGTTSNQAAGEIAGVKGSGSKKADFVQAMTPSMFRLSKSPVAVKHHNKVTTEVAPGRKVRVLILIEDAE
ncbi:anti-sigma factor [Anatilimnocola sp. NA78]|uniref:anti-sigma factor family protein n=1 Tax=Anatilimnocola sp. NA78 TaxID=3415683 RepID=UPI003CE4D2DA